MEGIISYPITTTFALPAEAAAAAEAAGLKRFLAMAATREDVKAPLRRLRSITFLERPEEPQCGHNRHPIIHIRMCISIVTSDVMA